jgi:hypothetical protein
MRSSFHYVKTVLIFSVALSSIGCWSMLNAIPLSFESLKKLVQMRAPRAPRIDAPTNPIVGPDDSNACDVQLSIGLLNQIIHEITECCNELQQDFIVTFSLVDDVVTTLTLCCDALATDFAGTFTTLTEINDTLTACCEQTTHDFQGTFTALAAGFNGTSTVLADIKNSLTGCCIQTQINFDGTFTVISSLGTVVQCAVFPPCVSTQIKIPMTITVPGSYCLANDINGSIIINVDNVTLDLNGNTITNLGGDGVTVNTGNNRTVKNGTILGCTNGIVCTNNNTTLLENIIISDCSAEGITINDSSEMTLNYLLITTINGIGVHFAGVNDAHIIKLVTVTDSEQGFVFETISSSFVQDCNVLNCNFSSLSAVTAGGFIFNGGGQDIQIDNCSVQNFTGLDLIAGFELVNFINVVLRNCTVQNIVATNPGSIAKGISLQTTTTVALFDCLASNVDSPSLAQGFDCTGQGISFDSCIAQAMSSAGSGDGFTIEVAQAVSMVNCQANFCTNQGFFVNALSADVLLQYCSSNYNSIGFISQTDNTLIGNCVAFKNSNTGFSLASLSTPIYYCCASQNGTDYINAVNVQNANTQVNNADPVLTGPFAGANLFI